MAQLDPMLLALAERGAAALYLADGSPPTFRFPDGDRAVSQQVLSGARIVGLLTELADGEDAGRLAEGRPVNFVYRMENGSPFSCSVEQTDGRLSATIRAEVEATSPAPAVSAPRAGAPEIEKYLMLLHESGASDLHLSSVEAPLLRKDGDMVKLDSEPVRTAEQLWSLLEPILPEHKRSEFEETHDTDFAYEIAGVARFRVNFFMDLKGPGAVFRIIPHKIMTVEDMGLSPAILNLCGLSKGLVLVTGPTGSGKSTTLAAMLDYINRNRPEHIITIEDPIEFVHPNKACLVNQREVGTHTGSFKNALRAALREDPDVVLVGELRDLETVAIAIETAETGHLVFGTLHTTTAASTIDRIIDQFSADRQGQIRTMLSESLRGVISQNLLKKQGGGRVPALEVLIVTPAISNLIREGKTFQIPSSMQTGKKHGMVLQNDALLELVRSGAVTAEEAFSKTTDHAGLDSRLRQAGIATPV